MAVRQRLSHKEEHTRHLISDDLSEPRTASHSQGKDFTTDILLGLGGNTSRNPLRLAIPGMESRSGLGNTGQAQDALLQLNRIIGDLPVHGLGLAYEVALVILRIYPLPIAPEGLNRMLVYPLIIVPELWSTNGLDQTNLPRRA